MQYRTDVKCRYVINQSSKNSTRNTESFSDIEFFRSEVFIGLQEKRLDEYHVNTILMQSQQTLSI